MAKAIDKDTDVSYSDPQSADQGSSSSLSSDTGSSSDELRSPRPRKSEVQYLISVIFGHIRSLYKISLLLRRPAIHDKYIRSTPNDQALPHFASWDKAHVSEKMGQWAMGEGFPYKEPIDPSNHLVSRLAAANTRRREQLKYWQKHPDRPTSISVQPAASDKQQSLASKDAEAILQNQTRSIESAVPREDERKTATSSKNTKYSFSTVAKSELNDNETFSGRPKTVYEPSENSRGRPLRVPGVPCPPPESLTFDCPFCYSKLDVKTMQQRQLWKKHVFRDLRPYVCTFEKCLNAEKLYVTRHDWLYHEMQIHRRRWVCADDCNLSFNTKALMEQHMRDKHGGTFTELQLPIVLDICERPAEPEEMTDCPLCPKTLELSLLQNHLALHLEELALFVLPIEADNLSEDACSDKAKLRHNELSPLEMDDLSSLSAFSSTGVDRTPSLQDATEFAQFLKSKENYSSLEIVQQMLDKEAEVNAQGGNDYPVADEPTPPSRTPRGYQDAILIALVGSTGSGKSSFINKAASSTLKVGHDLDLCTRDIQEVSICLDGREMILIDSPGFDNLTLDLSDILELIALYLQQVSEKGMSLTGVIYMKRITDARTMGLELRNLRILRKLLGPDFYTHLALVTSKWDVISDAEGESRENQLFGENGYWVEVIRNGAKVHRYSNSKESAIKILRQFLSKTPIMPQSPKELIITEREVLRNFYYPGGMNKQYEQIEKLESKEQDIERKGETEGDLRSKINSAEIKKNKMEDKMQGHIGGIYRGKLGKERLADEMLMPEAPIEDVTYNQGGATDQKKRLKLPSCTTQ